MVTPLMLFAGRYGDPDISESLRQGRNGKWLILQR